MKSLVFSLKQTPTFALDCRWLVPNILQHLNTNQIAKLPLGAETDAPQVADFFGFSGENSQEVIFEASSKKLDFIGAAMTAGQLLCKGDVGDRLGDRMRRGQILVEGCAGDFVASSMVAGTIAVHQQVGEYTGFAMRRGTVLLNEIPHLHATIADCGTHQLGFLPLLLHGFKNSNSVFAQYQNQPVRRFAGDLSVNGRGELLIFNMQ